MKLPILDAPMLQQKAIGDPYLKVKLALRQSAVLPMAQAQEAIAIPATRITPMPNMSACMLGLLNHKSRVIWVADLSLLLGLSTKVLTTQTYNIAIIRSGKTPLGLVVPEIQGVVRLAVESVESPIGEVLPALVPYLRGCLRQAEEMLWVLDPDAIVQSSLLTEHE
jgi:positive phototaxis protein PixI